RIDKVFFPEVPVIRIAGRWTDPADPGRQITEKAEASYIDCLPAGMYVAVTNKGAILRHDKLACAAFADHGDLSGRGYPALVPIRGVDLFRQVGAPFDERSTVPFVVSTGKYRFYYRGAAERARGVAHGTWQAHIESAFPGINFPFVELLVGAAAFNQLES